MTDPRDGRRVALKKLPNVFQSLVSSKRVFRELKMLCFFKHENVSITSNFQYMIKIEPKRFNLISKEEVEEEWATTTKKTKPNSLNQFCIISSKSFLFSFLLLCENDEQKKLTTDLPWDFLHHSIDWVQQ